MRVIEGKWKDGNYYNGVIQKMLLCLWPCITYAAGILVGGLLHTVQDRQLVRMRMDHMVRPRVMSLLPCFLCVTVFLASYESCLHAESALQGGFSGPD